LKTIPEIYSHYCGIILQIPSASVEKDAGEYDSNHSLFAVNVDESQPHFSSKDDPHQLP
jgi:hypothetical protein